MSIDRFARSLQRPHFVAQVFSEQEQSSCLGQPSAAQQLAARFAAKEAFLKAVGCGLFDGVALPEIEVIVGASGAPELRLGPSAARALQARQASSAQVGLSFSGNLAIAFVTVH